jgi:hypothetical protein
LFSLVRIAKQKKKIEDYEAEIAGHKAEIAGHKAKYAEREKTIEIITTRLQGRKYTRNGDETEEQQYFIDMNMEEEAQQMKAELKDRKAELMKQNELTNDQMKDTIKLMEIAAGLMGVATPQPGLTSSFFFLSFLKKYYFMRIIIFLFFCSQTNLKTT